MHDQPFLLGSLFDTVPEPTMLPARAARLRATCATSCGKSNTMSVRRRRLAHLAAVPDGRHRQVHLAVAPGVAELVGRHRDRRERGRRLALEEAEALASSAGIRLRRLQSLTSISSRMWSAHCSASRPSARRR
jgi:hypothetical protein